MQYLAILLLLFWGTIPALLVAWLCRKRFIWVRKIAFTWIVIFSFLQILFAIDELSGYKEKRLFERLVTDFPTDFQSLDSERQLFSFALVADKIRTDFAQKDEKTQRLMQDFLRQNIKQLNFGIVEESSLWFHNGLNLSQMCIIFSAYHQVFPNDTSYQHFHHHIADFLYKEMNHSPILQISSYPNMEKDIWLCDNAGILYALYLHDSQYHTDYHKDLATKWSGIVGQYFMDKQTQLPCTQVMTDSTCYVKTRGGSTAWLIAYKTHFLPKEAEKDWIFYKQAFKFSFAGIGAAFWEYTDDTTIEDYDSGSILLGLGSVASGLSMLTARKQQDWLTYFQLTNTFKVVSLGFFVFPESNEKLLIDSILYGATI